MFQSGILFLRASLVGLSLCLLCACGLPGPGSSTNPEEDPDETTKYTDVTKVTVETNRAMRTNLQSQVFDLITPQQAWALRGLEENNALSEDAIDVIEMDLNFRDRGEILDPYVVDQPASRRGYDLLFQTAIEKQLDRLVRVTLPNGEVLYAPLAPRTVQFDNFVVVSVASHYVLKKLYEAVTTQDQLDDLLACNNENTNCSHQSRVKSTHILNLIDLVHEYDIEITPEMSVQDVMDLFEENLYLRNMVETGIQEILRTKSPVSRGTARNFNRLDGYEDAQQFRSLTYNSTFFALELSSIKNIGNVKRTNIGVSTSSVVPIDTQFTHERPASELPIYPRISHNTAFDSIRKDGLVSVVIPLSRDITTYTSDNIFITRGNTYLKHGVSSIDSFLSTEGNLMAGSVLQQHIDVALVGSQSNPVYKQMYRVNEYEPNLDADSTASNTPLYPDTAPWLVSGNVIKAENYSVTETRIDNKKSYERVDWLEDRHVFSWEVHSEETDTEFSTTRMRGKTYGVLRYGLQLGNNNPVVQLNAETLLWQADSSVRQITSTQPDSHYRSRQLARAANHSMIRVPAGETGPNILAPETLTYSYEATPTTEDDNDPQTPYRPVSHNKGLINLGSSTLGHASSNGSHFSLVVNRPTNDSVHRAFIVGTELYSGPGVFQEIRYQLQGNTMAVNPQQTRLTNLNQSTLVLSNTSNGCEAQLTVRFISIIHNIGNNTIGQPERLEVEPETITSTACTIEDSKVTLVFDDEQNLVMNQPLTLTGFFSKTEDGSETSNLINLLWLQQDNMGLVFATRDQELPSHVDKDQPIND